MTQTDTRQRVAAAVRAELARQNKSGSALARHLNLPQTSISKRMHGRVPFTADQLVAVAEWLDIPVTTLLLPTKETA